MKDLPWITGICALEDESLNDSTFLDAWRAVLRNWGATGATLRNDGRIIGRATELRDWALLDADADTMDVKGQVLGRVTRDPYALIQQRAHRKDVGMKDRRDGNDRRVMHVIEKLWTAGECCFREGTDSLRQWIEAQKDRLYAGNVDEIIAELCRRHAIAVTGPGNKGSASACST